MAIMGVGKETTVTESYKLQLNTLQLVGISSRNIISDDAFFSNLGPTTVKYNTNKNKKGKKKTINLRWVLRKFVINIMIKNIITN
jgi:hypothetical protein